MVVYKHFSEMPVWQRAHAFVLYVYQLSARFPEAEKYALTSQMRRAAVSVSSNIAEAFGRQHSRDKANFYYTSRGSLYEVEDQVSIAVALGYLDGADEQAVHTMAAAIIHDLNKITSHLTR